MDSESSSEGTQHLQLVRPDREPAASAVEPELRSEEEWLWRGQPSLHRAIPTALKGLVALGVAIALAHGWAPWGGEPLTRPAGLSPWFVDVRVWMVLFLVGNGINLLDLATLRYELTADRLRITRGFLRRRTLEWPLHLVRSITLAEPWFVGRPGCVDLVLHLESLLLRCDYCGTRKTSPLQIRGVKDGPWLRSKIHERASAARG
jgi:hypothetical protein